MFVYDVIVYGVLFFFVRDECKEKTRPKTRKKVSFNLNVQILEPKPTAYHILESEEEEESKKGNDIKEISSSSILGEKSEAVNYPSNHRYYNCLETFNEEDEIEDEASNCYDDDDDEFDDEDDDYGDSEDDEDQDQDRSKVGDENEASFNQCCEMVTSSVEEDQVKSEMHSVLRPVENLTQWKAMKAKVASSKHRRKEDVPPIQKTSMELLSEPGFNLLESNVSKPLLTDIAVDASFSKWLAPPYASKTTIHCQ